MGLVESGSRPKEAIESKANVYQLRSNHRLKSATSVEWNVGLRRMVEPIH